MVQAQNTLLVLNFAKTTLGHNSYDHEMDNAVLHELLNDSCVSFTTLCDQDVWVFGDGSYITRNVDEYFFDNDVTDFQVTHDMN